MYSGLSGPEIHSECCGYWGGAHLFLYYTDPLLCETPQVWISAQTFRTQNSHHKSNGMLVYTNHLGI